MTGELTLRAARPSDLGDFVRLEQLGFASDRFSREQFRYLLSEAHASAFVVSQGGAAVGTAIVLWRKNATVGRLYSIVLDPAYQGKGLAQRLLAACERAAREEGCTRLSLEVRADNARAIRFYEREGFRALETLPAYYEDGTDGLKMWKRVEADVPDGIRLDLPYYPQTLEFTCGAASLMMAMKHYDPGLKLNRALELMLWKEATLIFMTSGLGGCGPFGLALAARRRGYGARVLLSSRRTPFLSSVRSEDKKEVVRLVHEQLRQQADASGVRAEYRDFSAEDVIEGLAHDEVPILLISTYRLHQVKAPHWVAVTGHDETYLYFHDPYEGFYVEDKLQAQHVRIPLAEFPKIRRYGKDVTKSVVFLSRGCGSGPFSPGGSPAP